MVTAVRADDWTPKLPGNLISSGIFAAPELKRPIDGVMASSAIGTGFMPKYEGLQKT